MTIWETYPEKYRAVETQTILTAVQAGECVCVLGLSGSGKSNLLGFMANRVCDGPNLRLADCNRIPDATMDSLFSTLIHLFDPLNNASPTLLTLIPLIDNELKRSHKKCCILLDRFDRFQSTQTSSGIVFNQLRALRDQFKYDLVFVISSRYPLDTSNELSELFYSNTFWLGPLSYVDAKWSICEYAHRHGVTWEEKAIHTIYELSSGYPSFMRAVCEAYSQGVELTVNAMLESDPVIKRLKEFWQDTPDHESLVRSRIAALPFLMHPQSATKTELTALEERLLQYLTLKSGEICSKEELISAIWPDEKIISGLRDDSLTQLVHRLREKIDPARKKLIQSIPGRGYRLKENN